VRRCLKHLDSYRSLVTVCGFVQALGCGSLGCLRFSPRSLGSLTGIFGGPELRVPFDLVAAV